MKAAGSTWPGDTRASKASASGDFQHTVQPQAHTELLPGLQSASNPQPQSVPVNQTPLMNPGALSAQAVVALGPSGNLTASQRGELELAKARAERAAASRKTTGASGSSAAGRSSSAKRGRANHPATDDNDEDYDDDIELAKLSPEEQERIISAKLASGTTTDKDARRLKRLLRNRVSAQQARERKKQYVTSLEEQIREQQAVIGVLEKRVKDLESQNEALRNIIRTMRPFRDPAPGAAGAGAGAGGATAPESAPGAQAGGAGAAARPPGAGQGQGQQLTPQQQQAMRARALALMQRRQAEAAAAAGAAEARGGEGQQQLLQEVPPSVQQHQQQLLPPTIQGPHHLQAPQPQPQPHEPHRRSLDESGSDTGHNAGSGTGGPKHFVPASPTAVDSLHQYHQQHQHYQYSQQTGQQQHHMQLPGHSQGHAMETNGTDLGGGDGHQMLDVQLGSSPMTSYGAVPFYGLPTFDIDLGDAAVVPPGPADGL